MEASRNRRWFPRYSLRGLFVGVTLLACILAYYVNWKREREKVLTGLDERTFPRSSYSAMNDRLAPGLLPLLGERGYTRFSFYFEYGVLDHLPTKYELSQIKPKPEDADLVERLKRLFPEATIEFSGFVVVNTPETWKEIDVPGP